MASLKEKRRQEIAKLLKAARDLGAPAGGAAERTIWAILARHGTKEGASRATKALWRRFVNPNECRVAKATEIAGLIYRNVKNDATQVAEQIRGYLRRFHKDHHTMDYGLTESMTNEQIKKYLNHVEGFAQETALALFFHYCAVEESWSDEPQEGDDGKPRKRGERDVIKMLDRLRLLCGVAAFGAVPAKTKLPMAPRQLGKAWSYSPLPARAAAGATTTAAKKKAAPKKTAPAKKTAKKKTVAKKAAKKKETARGGGTARPRTTRTARKRSVARKSSRR